MTTAALDRLLAVLVVTMAATGLLSLRAGSPGSGWLFVVHGVVAGMLVAAAAWKVRLSLPRAVGARRWGRAALGSTVALVAAAALSGGYLWVASGRIVSVGSFTVMTLHAWAGLVLVPLVVAHLAPRRWRLLRPAGGPALPRLGRRNLLVAAAFGAAGLGGWTAAAALERLRGGTRRFTGSRWLPAGGIPPSTTFLGEGAPPIDSETWRLRAGDRSFSLDELEALGGTDLTAVLDCTSGWAIETGWHGVPLAAVLQAIGRSAPGRSVVVRSVTGWSANLPIDEARRCLLAWEVAGEPLPVANGAPLRLVAPDRRGLDWVKWVSEIEVA